MNESSSADKNLLALALAISKRGNIGPTIKRGMHVMTYGPWSNGHMEQVAVVTNVRGDGTAPGSLCNLHVFVDLGAPMLAEDVPWFDTWHEAEQAMTLRENKMQIAGPVVCYSPQRE